VQNLTGPLELAEQVIARCKGLARLSEDSDRTRRTFLSPPMHDVHREITSWLAPLGAKACIDAAGNLRAVYAAEKSEAPTLLIGSHLDTVPGAGAYDGILGVVIGVALLQRLAGKKLPYAIELVGFSEEEGVRFGIPFIGSRALVGRLDQELLDAADDRGVTVRQAIQAFGLNPGEISQASLQGNVIGYVEFHIEQGPVLENLGFPLASVHAIAGQSRLAVTFVGRANHAGTTPMDLRFDALAGAAEWIMNVEREAKSIPGLVATVGSAQAIPGAGNVIAGETRLSLDVRHREDETRVSAVKRLLRSAEEIARRRGLTVQSCDNLNQPSVPLDRFLSDQIDAAIRETCGKSHRMASGAGHDAMILAEKVPAAMIFLRTPGGISHDPAESVAVEDVQRAIECGLNVLQRLARS
jgi:allantoate deiminase